MKLGEQIAEYRVVTEPQTGGMGQWALVERDATRYFMKAFLSPKYPLPTSHGSERIKAAKRQECELFENRHQAIRNAVLPDAEGAGNLVVTIDFFRVDSTFYKVTEMVEAVALPPLATLEPRQTLTILRSLLLSLRLLHHQRVVHSDIKLDNILYKESTPGVYVAKLIDFDEAYLAGRPPTREEIVGDQRFYSPELLRYIKGDESITERDMTTASDVYSLGLLIHIALTGSLPGFDEEKFDMACQASVAGERLQTPTVGEPLASLLDGMLQSDHRVRPDVDSIINAFTTMTPTDLGTMLRGGSARGPVGRSEPSKRGLRGTLSGSAPKRPTTPASPHPGPPKPSGRGSRLRGTLPRDTH